MNTSKQPKKIAGHIVLRPYERRTVTGRREVGYVVRCKCGAEIEVVQHVITRAKLGKAKLRCAVCQARDKSLESLTGYHKRRGQCNSKSAPPLAPKRLKPDVQFDEPTLKLIRGLLKKSYWPRIREIAEKTIAGHIRERLQPDCETIFREAEQLTILEFQTGLRDEDWTPENRAEGLQICRYEIYQMPALTLN